jgi:hypothetical protein
MEAGYKAGFPILPALPFALAFGFTQPALAARIAYWIFVAGVTN